MHIFSRNSIYQIYSGKTKCMYFIIKDENILDKCMKIWEKVSNIIKKMTSEVIYTIKNI